MADKKAATALVRPEPYPEPSLLLLAMDNARHEGNAMSPDDPAPRSLPPAAAAAGALPAGAAAPGSATVRSGGRVAVRHGVRRRRCGRGRRVRAAAVRPAAAPPGAAGARPAAAHVQPGRGHVRGRRRLPGLHRLPGAVLPVLPGRRSALHPAAAPDHYDPERVRGRRAVRGAGADAAAARAARRAALARAPRRAAAAPSAMALGAAARGAPLRRPPGGRTPGRIRRLTLLLTKK